MSAPYSNGRSWCEGAVHDDRDLVLVRDLGDRRDINQVRVRVANGLDVDKLRVVLDGSFKRFRTAFRIHEGRVDAVIRQRVFEQVVRSTVQRVRRDNVLPLVRERLHRVGDCRRAGRHRQRRRAALKSREAALQDVLRRVRQTPVDVARVAKTEAIRRMLEVVEHIGRGLVNRHRAGIRRRIGLFLSHMKLQCLKFVLPIFFCHFSLPQKKN